MAIRSYITRDMCDAYADECDGAFLILDTHANMGYGHTDRDVQRELRAHLNQCDKCLNTALQEGFAE